MRFVKFMSHIVIKPDFPDKGGKVVDGIFIPEPHRIKGFDKIADGKDMALERDPNSVVSGTVVQACHTPYYPHRTTMGYAKSSGFRYKDYGNGTVDVMLPMTAPVEGDKVWFGRSIWAAAERDAKTVMDGDDIFGAIPVTTVHLGQRVDGTYYTPKPAVLAEPIAFNVNPGDLVNIGLIKTWHHQFERAARIVGNLHGLAEVNPGDIVIVKDYSMADLPVPFTKHGWSIHPVPSLIASRPGMAPSSAEILEKIKVIGSHNERIAEAMIAERALDSSLRERESMLEAIRTIKAKANGRGLGSNIFMGRD